MKIHSIIFIFISVLISSCKQSEPSQPSIMVTIEPLRYFAETIVGDNFKVISMVPKGSSPETYDPTPQQLMTFSKSSAYFQIGYIGFELAWMNKLTANAPELPVFDTSKGINLIYAEEHKHGDHSHGGIEPHIWNSIPNAKLIAKNILEGILSIDNENTEFYTENYNLLIQEIDAVEKEIDSLFSQNDVNQGFMIYHPALSYFAKDYGLKQISIEEEGKEPTPGHMKKLINACFEENIHIIFIQPEFDIKNAEVIAEQTKSIIVPINPLSYNWKEEMLNTAKALIIKAN